MGPLIPERVFDEVAYNTVIYEPIMNDIRPFDKNSVMDHHFLNSRGAIARFDRGAIEIRVIDVQECPSADLAVCAVISELLKSLIAEKDISLENQKAWHENDLRKIFDDVIKYGSETKIKNEEYLKVFGLKSAEITAAGLWRAILDKLKNQMLPEYVKPIEYIIKEGNLSERILKKTGKQPLEEVIISTYKELARCLQENKQL